MGYHYKLEALLRVRCFEEERLQKELAEVQLLAEQTLAQLSSLIELQTKTEFNFHQRQTEPTTGPEFAMYRLFLQGLSVRIMDQKKKVREAEKKCEQKREALLEAVKNRKAIDKLKEKELLSHQEKMNREEENFINEMAISRFTLNQG